MKRKPVKDNAAPELINGRSMMAVCLLFDEIKGRSSRGLAYLRVLLKDYKHYQSEVQRCLGGCYEVLLENEKEATPEDVQSIKKMIAAEMSCVWGNKHPSRRKEKEKTNSLDGSNDESPTRVTETEEEVDWASRFTSGEFDLE